MSLIANTHRDEKTRPEPFNFMDFSPYYRPQEDEWKPTGATRSGMFAVMGEQAGEQGRRNS